MRAPRLRSALVDTGAELSWFPADVLESLGIQRRKAWRFRQADGSVLERWSGPAFVYVAGTTATDDVVFGEPGDLTQLGAWSLEGLNLRVDPFAKQLIDAGPAPAAALPAPPRAARGMGFPLGESSETGRGRQPAHRRSQREPEPRSN